MNEMIQTKDLCFEYQGEEQNTQVLKQMNLSIRKGEFIAVLGHNGSGKSTLAKQLGSFYHAPVLHLDAVHFLPGWVERVPGEEEQLVTSFLDTHSSWVMDGNYTKTCYARRLEEAGGTVELHEIKGVFHGYDVDPRTSVMQECLRNRSDALRRGLWGE